MTEIMSTYPIKLINSFILTILFLGSNVLSRFFLNRKIKSKKTRTQYITRSKYFFLIAFMAFFVTIWAEGFLQILALFGFLSAAFTLTQRENLMNVVGWLIINWRGLFSEEDHIRISNFCGSVRSIGVLYFTLVESHPDFPETKTGRIIKVPNGMVSRNPVMNLSQEGWVECTLNFVFKPKANLESLEVLYLRLRQSLHEYFLQWSMGADSVDWKQYEPQYLVRIRQEKPAGYEMVFSFFCHYPDKGTLQHKLNKLIIDYTAQNEEITLAFD